MKKTSLCSVTFLAVTLLACSSTPPKSPALVENAEIETTNEQQNSTPAAEEAAEQTVSKTVAEPAPVAAKAAEQKKPAKEMASANLTALTNASPALSERNEPPSITTEVLLSGASLRAANWRLSKGWYLVAGVYEDMVSASIEQSRFNALQTRTTVTEVAASENDSNPLALLIGPYFSREYASQQYEQLVNATESPLDAEPVFVGD